MTCVVELAIAARERVKQTFRRSAIINGRASVRLFNVTI
jgi:hypothetical protein